MRVWIDLANSPHPLLFAPVARRLQHAGHDVVLTARDNAQTVELARERWPDVEVIGGPSPQSRLAKAATLATRVRALRRWARTNAVELALSHNSYAQILAARALRVPVVTAMDFEHQPANHLAFRLADVIVLPAALRGQALRSQGASRRKVRFYDGLKEEIYLGDFEPSAAVLGDLGLAREEKRPIVVVRTPPSRASYHRFGNPLFLEALEAIGEDPAVRCVTLVRHPEQRLAIESMGLANCTIPTRAIDSRSLMRAADLVIGAGGTMTREAALLGVPTLSVFAGAEPAVDRWLREQGLLCRLSSPEQLRAICCREQEPRPMPELKRRSAALIDVVLDAVQSASSATPGR
jgi:uncharacterized protein